MPAVANWAAEEPTRLTTPNHDLRAATRPAGAALARADSAGRMWVVLPALLPRFCPGGGVASGAWVPAWPPNRLTPFGLSLGTTCRPGPRLMAPTGAAGLICLA